jgi:hypothetical protein
MPFGLNNALATYQHFINDFLRPFLNYLVMAYLGEILL